MKSLPFTIPSSGDQSFLIQLDNFEHFYPFLHRHPEIQITQIKRGKGFLLSDNEVFPFEEEDIYIIASDVSHVFKDDSSTDNVESISVFFKYNEHNNTILSIPEFKDIAHYFGQIKQCQKLNGSLQLEVKTILEDLVITKNNHQKIRKFQELLFLLFNRLEKSTTDKFAYSEKDGDIMKRIVDFTLAHFNTDIGVKDIADEIGYTPQAFCRFFKRRTDKTYITYLNELRIYKATQLLMDTNLPIGEIAYQTGFNNVTHFNRVFKQKRNTNPGKYRNNVLGRM